MPFKTKNDKGEEIDAFTADELAAKAKEAADKAVEEAKKSNPEVAALKADLDKTNKALKEAEELVKSGGNPEQIARLKAAKEEAEKKLETEIKAVREEIKGIKDSSLAELKSDLLNRLSRGDEETKKKIELEFDKYDPANISKEGIKSRLEKAATIVLGNKPSPRIMDGMVGSSGKGELAKKDGTYTPKNDNEKAIGNALNISEEDRKKYGHMIPKR